VICFSSCDIGKKYSEESLETFKLNPETAQESILLSEIIDSIKFIKLETTNESFLGQIKEIIIRDKFIYVMDKSQQAVFVFDHQGKLMNKLEMQGEGPDQYKLLGPVFVDQKEEYIEIMDFGSGRSKILKYAIPALIFLEETPFYMPSANSARRGKDGVYYFATQQNENSVGENLTNGDIIVIDKNGENTVLFDKKIPFEGSSFSPFVESFAYNDEGELFISLMYNNTFFKLKDKKAVPFLTLDFGEYGIDPKVGQLSIKEQFEFLQNETNGKVTFPVLNAQSSKLLAFSYYFKDKNNNNLYQYLEIKSNRKKYHTQSIINDLTEFPERVFISSYYKGINYEVMYNDYLVDLILPSYALEEAKELDIVDLGLIKVEDNPIIMLMKLKK